MKNLIIKDPIARMKGKYLAFLFVSLLLSTSCYNDGTLADPVPAFDNTLVLGTDTFNMMNESNGQTKFAQDIYITNSNNFYSATHIFSSLGKVDGLGSIPSEMLLLDGTNTAAVEQGNAYQVFFRHDVREFPSGKLAIDISSVYNNIYVVSQIKQNDTIVGAKVHSASMRVPDKGLPAKRKHLIVGSNPDTWTLVAEFPTSDFEYELLKSYIIIDWEFDEDPPYDINEEDLNTFECKKEGNKLYFDFDYKGHYNMYHSSYMAYIRIDNVYTTINFNLVEKE